MTDEPMLSAKSITKRFGKMEALSNLEIDVYRDSIVALIGPNGSGKTTFINTVSGLLTPESGEILFEGKNIRGMKPHKISHLGINRTFQIPHPFPSLSVLENVQISVRFGTDMRGSDFEDRSEELIKFAELSEFSDKLASDLNTSQKKMLDLAKAMATNPKLLLVDELAAGLNPAEMDAVAKKIGELKERGISLVIVEHVMNFIKKITDDIIVMDAGKKIFDGKFKDAVNDETVRGVYFGKRDTS